MQTRLGADLAPPQPWQVRVAVAGLAEGRQGGQVRREVEVGEFVA